MNLQERIDFILNKHFPASVKRKHLVYLMKHLGEYSEDADELGEAYATICEALEQLDMEIGENETRLTMDKIKESFQRTSEMDKLINEQIRKRYPLPNAKQPLTVTELDRTLEFFLTYNILSMHQVQDIRAKAAAYLR